MKHSSFGVFVPQLFCTEGIPLFFSYLHFFFVSLLATMRLVPPSKKLASVFFALALGGKEIAFLEFQRQWVNVGAHL